jgi:hypothetical protein
MPLEIKFILQDDGRAAPVVRPGTAEAQRRRFADEQSDPTAPPSPHRQPRTAPIGQPVPAPVWRPATPRQSGRAHAAQRRRQLLRARQNRATRGQAAAQQRQQASRQRQRQLLRARFGRQQRQQTAQRQQFQQRRVHQRARQRQLVQARANRQRRGVTMARLSRLAAQHGGRLGAALAGSTTRLAMLGAVTGATVVVGSAILALRQLHTRMGEMSQRLAYLSPALATAQARQQAFQLQADVQSARRTGGLLAQSVELEGRQNRALQKIGDDLTNMFGPLVVGFEEFKTELLEKIAGSGKNKPGLPPEADIHGVLNSILTPPPVVGAIELPDGTRISEAGIDTANDRAVRKAFEGFESRAVGHFGNFGFGNP